MDNSRINLSAVSPIINDLSDHDAQILTVRTIYATINKFSLKQRTRLIDNKTVTNFQAPLKTGSWESAYTDRDPNHMLNSFLCTFLNIFQASFTVKYRSMKDMNDWITRGIKISCKHQRSLYAFTKNSNDSKAKVNYIKHCKIIRKVIKEAKSNTTVDL